MMQERVWVFRLARGNHREHDGGSCFRRNDIAERELAFNIGGVAYVSSRIG
jgi:hypothetical protein